MDTPRKAKTLRGAVIGLLQLDTLGCETFNDIGLHPGIGIIERHFTADGLIDARDHRVEKDAVVLIALEFECN